MKSIENHPWIVRNADKYDMTQLSQADREFNQFFDQHL